MKFRSAYSPSEGKPSPSGERLRKLYRRELDSQKNSRLVEDGVEDTYLFIQEAAKGATVAELVSRFNRGDLSAVTPLSEDFLINTVDAPSSFMEAQNLMIRARSVFDSLPKEVRDRYNSNFNTFLSAVDSGAFFADHQAAVDLAKAKQKAAEVANKINEGGSSDV